jgi:hypothetical protein
MTSNIYVSAVWTDGLLNGFLTAKVWQVIQTLTIWLALFFLLLRFGLLISLWLTSQDLMVTFRLQVQLSLKLIIKERFSCWLA